MLKKTIQLIIAYTHIKNRFKNRPFINVYFCKNKFLDICE